jgi:transcriptional regulator with XRE-family HTH domain
MELTLILVATMTPQEIMQHIVAARKEKGYSQDDIAKKLGISQVQFSKYESGISDIQLSKFLELLKILDLDIADFSDSVNNSKEELLNFIDKQEKSLKQLKGKLL